MVNNGGNFVGNFAYSSVYAGGSSLIGGGAPAGGGGGLSGLNALLNTSETGTKRERTKFNEYQLRHLERAFEKCQYPQGIQREQLAIGLRLTETKVQVWFKNRRAKERANKKYEELRQQLPPVTASSSASSSSSSHHSLGGGGSFISSKLASAVCSMNGGSSGSSRADQSSTLALVRGVKSENGGSNLNLKESADDSGVMGGGGSGGGGTEDENEGSKPAPTQQTAAEKRSLTMGAHHFPASMPIIPLPSSLLDFDLGGKFEVSTTAANLAAAASQQSGITAVAGLQPSLQPAAWDYGAASSLNSSLMSMSSMRNGCWAGGVVAPTADLISPFSNPLGTPAAHSNWMTSPAASMFNMGGMATAPFPPSYPISAAAAAAANYYTVQQQHQQQQHQQQQQHHSYQRDNSLPPHQQPTMAAAAAATAAVVTASAYDLYNYQQAAAAAYYAHAPTVGMASLAGKEQGTTALSAPTNSAVDSKFS